jgi:hypothetical protein
MIAWNARMSGSETVSRETTVRVAFVLVILCFFIWGSLTKLKIEVRGIHLVCLLWIIIMPIIMYINGCSIGDTTLMVLWPILYESTYYSCFCNKTFNVSLQHLYIIVALIGAFFFLQSRINISHQSNTVYFCFLTLPWLLFGRKKRTQLWLLVLFTFIALLSLKRSMMLTSILIWMFYLLERVRQSRIAYVVTGTIVLLFVFSQIYDRIDESLGGQLTQRVTREETDSGHDRLLLWELTIEMIQKSPTTKLIEGHGYGGVRKNSFVDISAHNDFLEVIYDYGLIIFFLYLCLWAHVLRRCYFLFRHKSPLFFPYSVTVSIFIIMSMVSQLLPYATYFNYLVMFWAMTEAYVKRQKLVEKTSKSLLR